MSWQMQKQEEDFESKLPKITTFINKEDDARLDKILKEIMVLPQSAICKGLRKNLIYVNGKKAKNASTRLAKGDVIDVKFMQKGVEKPNVALKESIPPAKLKEIKNSIIFENHQVFVINKPFGIATQSGGGLKYSIDGIMRKIFSNSKIVHRLDKDTSGLLVVAKSKEVATILSIAFKRREVTKTYIAVVSGCPSKKSWQVKTLIGREPRSMVQKYTSINCIEGREAVTSYKVLHFDKETNLSMLELAPLTGRPHQLRVHCAEILKTPIVGDYRYGGDTNIIKKLHLCAYKIKLPNIICSTEISLTRLPSFFVLNSMN